MSSDSGPSMTLADFVIQEAKEKTFEIDIKTLKQFEKDKAVIVEKELQLIQEDFQKKMRKVEMGRKMLFFDFFMCENLLGNLEKPRRISINRDYRRWRPGINA